MLALSIIVFLLVFSFIILVHEAGHFFIARWSGVKVEEFALGMGKKIWGIKRGETEYNLNAVPFGGFVRMLGEEEQSKSPRAFSNATLFRRMAITLAGVFMNFIAAILLLTLLFSVGTNPILITEEEVTAAEAAGTLVFSKPDADGNRELLEIKPVQVNFPASLPFAVSETYRISKAVVKKAGEIPMEIIEHHRIPENIAGPVGIAEITHKITPQGLKAILKLTALLSISLAVMNLLPIPALDGGRFLFQLVEFILKPFRVKMSDKIENAIHMGGYLILMGLLLLITWNDITRLFFA